LGWFLKALQSFIFQVSTENNGLISDFFYRSFLSFMKRVGSSVWSVHQDVREDFRRHKHHKPSPRIFMESDQYLSPCGEQSESFFSAERRYLPLTREEARIAPKGLNPNQIHQVNLLGVDGPMPALPPAINSGVLKQHRMVVFSRLLTESDQVEVFTSYVSQLGWSEQTALVKARQYKKRTLVIRSSGQPLKLTLGCESWPCPTTPFCLEIWYESHQPTAILEKALGYDVEVIVKGSVNHVHCGVGSVYVHGSIQAGSPDTTLSTSAFLGRGGHERKVAVGQGVLTVAGHTTVSKLEVGRQNGALMMPLQENVCGLDWYVYNGFSPPKEARQSPKIRLIIKTFEQRDGVSGTVEKVLSSETHAFAPRTGLLTLQLSSDSPAGCGAGAGSPERHCHVDYLQIDAGIVHVEGDVHQSLGVSLGYVAVRQNVWATHIKATHFSTSQLTMI
jgi:hypothetical protein